MASVIWKARKEMNPLGCIFKNKLSSRNTRSSHCDKLYQPVPGHPEAASNKLAQIWNILNLGLSSSLGSARTSAREWFKLNAKNLN